MVLLARSKANVESRLAIVPTRRPAPSRTSSCGEPAPGFEVTSRPVCVQPSGYSRARRRSCACPGAASVAADGGLVVTCQGRYDQRSEQARGSGALVFTSTGRFSYRALPGERVAGIRIDGRYAYIQRALGFGEAFDLRTGKQTACAIDSGLAAALSSAIAGRELRPHGGAEPRMSRMV